eukprot:1844689-Amphidinium_carterae.2
MWHERCSLHLKARSYLGAAHFRYTNLRLSSAISQRAISRLRQGPYGDLYFALCESNPCQATVHSSSHSAREARQSCNVSQAGEGKLYCGRVGEEGLERAAPGTPPSAARKPNA